jgi:ribosomal 30S subunit maturation factor RimM
MQIVTYHTHERLIPYQAALIQQIDHGQQRTVDTPAG